MQQVLHAHPSIQTKVPTHTHTYTRTHACTHAYTHYRLSLTSYLSHTHTFRHVKIVLQQVQRTPNECNGVHKNTLR